MWLFALACHAPPDDSSPGPGPGKTGSSTLAPTTVPPAPTEDSPVLAVDGGFGGGQYPVGSTVRVWADIDPQAEIVTGWSDPALGVDWNGTLVMPDHDLRVAPTVEAVPTTISERAYALAGRDRSVLLIEAPSPAGLVLFFHGAGYSVDQLRDNAAAGIAKRLVRAGYTVVAVQSEAEVASGTGGWSASLSGSDDLENVGALIDALRSDGTVPGSAPVVAWGMSSGGIFAHTVGAAGLAEAVVAWCAAGSAEALAVTRARTGWYLAANDQTFPTSPADAEQFDAQLAARGVPTDRYVHPATPLYDQRFERIAGIDAARSAAIADAIRESGAVDAYDRWTVPGSAVDVDLSDLDPAQATAVRAEIEIMAADHELYDDVAGRMVAFLTDGR